jgi:hypothetical protein
VAVLLLGTVFLAHFLTRWSGKSEGAGADIGPNGEETVSSVPGITVEGGGALERLAPPVAIAPLDSLADLRGQGRAADEEVDSWAPAFLTALARARPGLRPPAVHRLTLSIGPEGANPAEKEAPADPAITRLADAALSGDAGAVAQLTGGQIKNVILNAARLAIAEESEVVAKAHFDAAIARLLGTAGLMGNDNWTQDSREDTVGGKSVDRSKVKTRTDDIEIEKTSGEIASEEELSSLLG